MKYALLFMVLVGVGCSQDDSNHSSLASTALTTDQALTQAEEAQGEVLRWLDQATRRIGKEAYGHFRNTYANYGNSLPVHIASKHAVRVSKTYHAYEDGAKESGRPVNSTPFYIEEYDQFLQGMTAYSADPTADLQKLRQIKTRFNDAMIVLQGSLKTLGANEIGRYNALYSWGLNTTIEAWAYTIPAETQVLYKAAPCIPEFWLNCDWLWVDYGLMIGNVKIDQTASGYNMVNLQHELVPMLQSFEQSGRRAPAAATIAPKKLAPPQALPYSKEVFKELMNIPWGED